MWSYWTQVYNSQMMAIYFAVFVPPFRMCEASHKIAMEPFDVGKFIVVMDLGCVLYNRLKESECVSDIRDVLPGTV